MAYRPPCAIRCALLFSGMLLGLLLGTTQALGGPSGAIPWRNSFESAQAEARASGRPLWVQFTGPWCVFCLKMERNVFNQPDIITTAHTRFIPVKVRGDNREDLIERFGISGLPATVILTPDGREVARQEGYLDPNPFRGFLASVQPPPEPAMGGYCPVSLVKGQGLVRGRESLAVQYDGGVYRFADENNRTAFLKQPEVYLPSNGGRCPVRQVKDGAAVAGNPRCGVYYRDRLYLCADEPARRQFAEHPEQFGDADLADRGYCPHCRGQEGRLVPGLPQFAATYAGRRYLFPDRVHLEAFRSSPETYLR
ncbi:MAG: thioredoxin family protein [Isosphaeraceae bacterium]